MNLVNDDVFKWVLTIITGSVAGMFLVVDAIRLVRVKSSTPNAHDKRFGYFIGAVVGFIGVWGCLRFHGVV
ncbi:MAG: hypothetical protein ABI867_21065 [Kofleriaceae bacterium]